MIRFKMVEVLSKVCFKGKRKTTLAYEVRSFALQPLPEPTSRPLSTLTIPEIFWQ